MLHTSFDIGSIAFNLVIVVLLVLLNGFFVAAEFALVKVRHSRIQQLVNEGSGKAKYASIVTAQLDTYLSATQLGITLASLGLGWVGEPAINELIMEPFFHKIGVETSVYTTTLSFVISFGFITFMHIVLGELAPKSFAIQKAELTSLWLSAPLLYFYKLFRPIIWVLNGAANRFLAMIGVEPAGEHEAAHTEEEIRILMDESVKSGHINEDEMTLFDNIFEFSDLIAREVMLPRTDMDCLYVETSFIDNLRMVHETKHTRYPVASQDKDHIVGFVHIADLLTADPDVEQEIKTFIRPILNVPESMEVSRILKLMQKKHSQVAIVVDEYGGTAGFLTLEDIMEEIVGELHDEFDINERPGVEVKDKYTSVDGRVLLEDLNDMLDLQIEDEDVDSIGGWLFKKVEGAPVKGKKIVYGNHMFEVTEVDRLRIVRIHITNCEPLKQGND
ncbi:hemolysin family protein [Paenibacillus roseipurpureus]|uniref:Hemolysin family protein n=1 Tax=Paenibacillus roseopurpureus TaxID=2918901 RepID=A0AA96LTM0_9BACL|nr:hemolysin family protein [Paenibacillus sp. MBLB1832]WNR47116.1 hemolysin family protein [Paenibacillus sp. MBLB1832]